MGMLLQVAHSVVFAPDGSCMVTVSADKTAKVWSTRDWSLRHTLPHEHEVYAAAFKPDGTTLVTASHLTAQVSISQLVS